ncbi:GTPase [Helicobacter pylori]|uniref:GTPase n=1 Tax=Helicobacter pylori TaxID=210 RepID=UPI003306CFED
MDQQECFKRLYADVKNYRSNERVELEKLQDGAIIGDGRSDSTLKTESYTLKHNNQSFVLLDVPGIEGDEKKLNSKFLTLQEKPMLFFMLQKHPLLRKKEKREKRERLKRSKTNRFANRGIYPIEIFKVEELLLKSQFKQLGKFIAGTLLENSRKKIIESNCNKALRVIEKLQKAIAITIDREIDPTIKEIRDKLPETYSNLDRSRNKFVSNLNNSVSKEIERFKTDFRIEMYERIEKDIKNKECKEIFENECKQRTKKLGENIKSGLRKMSNNSVKTCKRILDNLKRGLKIL